MIKKLKYPLAILGLVILGLIGSGQSASAAVPVWVVGFDANTQFELSLETFTKDLFQNIFGQTVALQGQISARQESFLQAYDLAKIMKAREDVNKLVFEAFSELRSEPLLLEFQKIRQACAATSSQSTLPGLIGLNTILQGNKNRGIAGLLSNNGGQQLLTAGATLSDFDKLRGKCEFYTEVQEYLRSRGLEIVSQPFKPSDTLAEDLAVKNAIAKGEDPLCLYGVRTNDGECITIKLEGRIITNPDDFLFEEPIQKARDFTYCYFGPWRHFPWGAGQKESDQMRDSMKGHFLLTIARKLKFTQTAPPPEWYTEARCQIILASLQCPLASQPISAVNNPSIPKDQSDFPVVNRDVACVARDLVNQPTLGFRLEDVTWDLKQLHEATTREENTVGATYTKVGNAIQSIIADFRQERNAEYIAGQGIRPEKYLIGYRSYTADQYKQLTDAWQKGGTIEDEVGKSNNLKAAQGVQPTGDWFYYDTGNIISPAIILLDKINAATQAEFNLAQAAFQAPKVPDSEADNLGIFSGPGLCGNTQRPSTLDRLKYQCHDVPKTFKANGIEINLDFHYWSTNPSETGADYTTGFYTPQDSSGNARALSAPWEDPNVKLPDKYLTGQAPQSKDENPELSGNYFNQWYKDILELHKWHFSAIVQQWFQKPEKSFFVPDR